MKLSQFKQALDQASELNFVLPNGSFVPRHFHVTEAGLSTKNFIDCGGTIRTEKNISFQVWVANDFEHRLSPQKLKSIIAIAEPLFGNEDLDIEVEYQTESISRFGLENNGNQFVLTTKQTDCLAKDHCGIPEEQMPQKTSCCSGTSCC